MESKIRIRLGAIEVEYEGSEAFLKKELPQLIKTVSELYQTANIGPGDDEGGGGGAGDGAPGDAIQLSTNSIAAKLGVKRGPDLAVAAAAHITLVRKTAVFSREELRKEMKGASSYYKATYGKNLTHTIRTLLKTKFNEPTSGNFALTAAAKKELRSKLAQSTSTA